MAQLQDHMRKIGTGKVASICGRYYAMDRDTRWERTEQAYRLYTEAEGYRQTDPVKAVAKAYERGQTDEFVKPIVIVDRQDQPLARVDHGDAIIFFNFRADRARQITRAFTDDGFKGFQRRIRPNLSAYVCMTLYDEHFNLPVAFAPEHLDGILGQVISAAGFKQLRIAETEKYAHVTYFFNGGEEQPFEGEDRCLIPSPRDVPTYDHKPEMSAIQVTDEVLKRIDSDQYDFIVLNFANMDMVGHTGNIEAAVKACETVDHCAERIVEAVKAKKGTLLITADHGNAETMRTPNGSMHTAHTTNPVKLIWVDGHNRSVRLNEGILADIAPTVLELMGIDKPEQMTGRSLVAH
jgi:2,3-bisphosphoglycerate-independent phosphoglycerate mutase